MGVTVVGGTTYQAREDSGTANNNALNPDVGVLAIQFTNDDPDLAGVDTLGDYDLNFNGGSPDPDTSLVYNGVSYSFTVNLVGTMLPSYPGGARVDPIYLNQQVVIVTFTDNLGVEHRVFFYPDTAQDATKIAAMRNGAIGLDVNPVLTCLCEGTEILTASGARAIETVRVGDFLLNDRGVAKQVIWIGFSEVPLAKLHADESLRPIRIAAGTFGPGCPESDLLVSSQHRIVVEGAAPAILFGEERVLVAAKHLVDCGMAERFIPTDTVRYYHVMLEEQELLMSNGLASESFQPARRTLDVMSTDNQQRLLVAIEALGAEEMLTRPDALPALSGREARVLLHRLQQFGRLSDVAASGKPNSDPHMDA